ncbi:MAG: L-2-amino-thiazoline-4-carboxylic acid hydrolase [Desulfovibrio sp.]
MANITQLDRRVLEAQVLRRVYDEALCLYGAEDALELIRNVQESAALEAGRNFAAVAPEGPSLEHFLTVLEIWQAGDAIQIKDLERKEHEATFHVSRCLYVESYRAMGMPEALLPLLSCARDEPFSRGYSEHLRMERPETLAKGFPACCFRFVWE